MEIGRVRPQGQAGVESGWDEALLSAVLHFTAGSNGWSGRKSKGGGSDSFFPHSFDCPPSSCPLPERRRGRQRPIEFLLFRPLIETANTALHYDGGSAFQRRLSMRGIRGLSAGEPAALAELSA
ncbi:hypothetical protein GN956_G9370 [Arapaima gigas]